jgi:hypothetical protein
MLEAASYSYRYAVEQLCAFLLLKGGHIVQKYVADSKSPAACA